MILRYCDTKQLQRIRVARIARHLNSNLVNTLDNRLIVVLFARVLIEVLIESGAMQVETLFHLPFHLPNAAECRSLARNTRGGNRTCMVKCLGSTTYNTSTVPTPNLYHS